MSSSSVPVYTVAPLTTFYTPPARCSTENVVYFYPSDNGYGYGVQGDPPRDCYAPGTGDNWQYTIWSPGVCPSGYTGYQETGISSTAPQSIYTSFCCPSGLNWHQTVGACYAPNIIWTQSIGSTVTGAFHIEVQWASSDLKSFSPLAAPLTTASAAPSSSTAAAASTTTTPTPTGPASTRSLAGAAGAAGTTVAANGNNGGGGLSTGAKAGIGVGVAVGVLAIIGAIIFLVYRRRKKSAAEQNTTYSQQPAETSEPQQMPDNQITSAYAHHKPAPAAPTELEGSQAYRTELDSGYQGHEMRSGYK